jgi:superfamily II DNA or RNA helicase
LESQTTAMANAPKNTAVESLQRQIRDLEKQRATLEAQLEALLQQQPFARSASPTERALLPKEKIALFRRFFAARPDVFALRWENTKDGRSGYAPACSNEWVAGICGKPKIKCGVCPNQAFIPVTDDTIKRHLRGPSSSNGSRDFVMGAYPLLRDDTCWFLAADFDGEHWADDALAYMETCGVRGVPAALERSRSGQGGHVWIFFAQAIPARDARQLGAALLTETMERRPEIGFASYDRLFPNQDTMPVGGFGNLIALPLARRSRERGNSVFVNERLEPYEDQWAFLESLQRMSPSAVSTLVQEAQESGRMLGVRMPVDEDETEAPWLLPPSRRRTAGPIRGALPAAVNLVLADGVYVDRASLPSELVTRLVRLAAFQNPEFYRAQAMRFPTYGKPRIISCAELYSRHITLPRGCLDETVDLLRSIHVEPLIEDRRESGTRFDVRFLGKLQPEQERALDALIDHDCGVLAATTAFGKTVVAAAAIARRGCSTLILVHRRELLVQWVERLKTFLSVESADVGSIGGGRRKPSGRIDVALVQSLVRKGEVSDLVAGYGHLVVDECHHISASTFEMVARRSKARYVLGLSATVARKDGHHPIIFMQCGPVRYRVDPRARAAQRSFDHIVQLRPTAFRLPPDLQAPGTSVPAIFAAVARDEDRNTVIIDDVLAALEAGRNPLLLTERRDHLEYLASCFKGAARNVTVLRGGMSGAERRAAEASLRAPDGTERLILATGRYLGEGFDDPRLDTLFLAMPISWKGTLAQYVGRLHRDHVGKKEVVVYDYVDMEVPVLARMAARRRAGYKALGYSLRSTGQITPENLTPSVTYIAGDDRRPSEVADDYWIYAERRDQDSYPEHSDRGGKWMLFIKNAEIDAWWLKIRTATELGLLGGSAKVATMKPNPNSASPDTRVICVYTYDIDDVADCTRVREALRDVGATWKIPYKTDADTYAGKYSRQGQARISKRYE